MVFILFGVLLMFGICIMGSYCIDLIWFDGYIDDDFVLVDWISGVVFVGGFVF